jgi:hypothetical protein
MGISRTTPATTITANRLSDGAVVFLANNAVWSEELSDALVLQSETQAEEALQAAETRDSIAGIVGPYAIDVEILTADQTPRPLRLRERIRATGPTTRPPTAGAFDVPVSIT